MASTVILISVPLSVSAQLSPSVTTLDAKQTSPESVKFEAFVVPVVGESVSVWFEYSTQNGLIERTNPVIVSFPTTVSTQILGLKNTRYFVQVVGQNTRGFVYGEVEDFTFSSSNPSLPRVTTREATNIRDTSAVLEGYIDPRGGKDTEFWFEWGTTGSLGFKTIAIKHLKGASSVRAILTGLKRGEVYYYRVVVNNSIGINRGIIRKFIAGKNSILPSQKSPATASFSSSLGIAVNTRVFSISKATTAKVSGQVLTGSRVATTAWFEWGETEALGNETTHSDIGVGYPFNSYNQTITGLSSSKTYYFRAVAQNANGFDKGKIRTFQTTGFIGTENESGDNNGGADDKYYTDNNGNLRDKDGHFINKKGNHVDKYGHLIDDHSNFIDEDGNLIDENGNIIENNNQKASTYNGSKNWFFPNTISGWILLLLLIILIVGYSHHFYGVYEKRKEDKKHKKEIQQQGEQEQE